MLRAKCGGEQRLALKKNVLNALAKPLPHDLRIAPLRRWRDAWGWRWHITTHHCEHSSDKQFRRPGGERDGPAALEHTQHLLERDVSAGREDMPVLTDNDIKRAVRK